MGIASNDLLRSHHDLLADYTIHYTGEFIQKELTKITRASHKGHQRFKRMHDTLRF